jgi:hypothetical protein
MTASPPTRRMFIPFLGIAAFLIIGALAANALAAQVTLSWNPNTESDLAGYRLHYGKASGSYTTSVDASRSTSYTLTGLNPGQSYFFSATAYNTAGKSSGYSSEVAYTVPAANANTPDPPAPSDPPASKPIGNSPTSPPAGPNTGGNTGDRASSESPAAPVLVSPAAEEKVSSIPVLKTAAFKSANSGTAHAKTHWQVFRDDDDACVLDIETGDALTNLAMPHLLLDAETSYFWRARFFDKSGLASEWSDYAYFSTEKSTTDLNANGIPDALEVGPKADLDNDGVKDCTQLGLKAIKLRGSDVQIGVSIKGSPTAVAIESVESENPRRLKSLPGGRPGKTPLGLINLKIAVANPGDQTEVKLYLSEAAPLKALWYHYDPIADTWDDFSAYAIFAPDRKSVTLTLRDGGPGDVDGTANGVIVDPAGLVVLKDERGERYLTGQSRSSKKL